MSRHEIGRPFRVWLPAVALAFAALQAAPAQGQGTAQTTSPVEVVRARNAAVESVLRATGDSVDAATREKLKDLINDLIDFEEMSRRALGRHWAARSERERAEFVDVFRQLVRNSSVKKLGIYRADRISYEPSEVSGDEATVTTRAHKDDRSVGIVYHMHRVGGEWRAYDIVIDEASTMRAYRDSFHREIARSSYEAMFEKLTRKLREEP